MKTEATKYTLQKMNQDVVPSKHSPELYYDAKNIRFITNNNVSTGGFVFEKGNKLVATIPDIIVSGSEISYGSKTINFSTPELAGITSSTGQEIISHTITRNSIILFTTEEGVYDCIWELDNSTYDLTLLYLRDLNFSKDNPIQAIYNYENTEIEKVYWVDGANQLRYVNIKDPDLFNTPANTLNQVGNVSFSQPQVSTSVSGGSHTSGVIQYTYNLYRLNGSQTKMSPLSQLVSLDKGPNQGGGSVNENVGTTVAVTIPNLDPNYTHLKIYSIKYTSLNQIPTVSLIEEREIGANTTSVTVYDDGTAISTISVAELLFLGSNPITPKHIETKDNILFPINITEDFFDIDLDMRAYCFNSNGLAALIYDNVVDNGSGVPTGSVINVASGGVNYDQVPKEHDAVNIDYNTYKYQSGGGSVLGASGKYLDVEIVQKTAAQLSDSVEEIKFLKDREIYRIGIQFYNSLGQLSPAKWICDYKMPVGNLNNSYNTLKVTLNSTFQTWLDSQPENSQKPIGFKIIRAERTLNDRTIMDQGMIQPSMFQVRGDSAKNLGEFNTTAQRQDVQDNEVKLPTWISRTFEQFPNDGTTNDVDGKIAPAEHLVRISALSSATNGDTQEIYTVGGSGFNPDREQQSFVHSKMMYFYSPEILFDLNNNFPDELKLKVHGTATIDTDGYNYAWGKEIVIETGLERFGGKIQDGLNFNRVNSSDYIYDNTAKALHKTNTSGESKAFIAPSGEETTMDFYQYFRSYTSGFSYGSSTDTLYDIYGSPEVAERGAGNKVYNNDSRFTYSNSLESVNSCGFGNDVNQSILGVNSYGAQCAVFVLGDNPSTSTANRVAMKDMYDAGGFADESSVLITELVRDTYYPYFSGMYGGTSYEDKLRTTYLEIGDYIALKDSLESNIENAGDTFVQKFKFARIAKTDTDILADRRIQHTEIVEVNLETTVDLKNRSDFSLAAWDSDFQPSDTDYHEYNTVYSQEPTLVQNNAFDFNFRLVKGFDNKIAASRVKIPNETIDSWTDLQENEELVLDGKYGPINGTVNFNDEIYCFQDNAVALLAINPRVQTVGQDGVTIELGTGGILYDYQYLSTRSGSVNKWGIVSTQSAIYYTDALNKSFHRLIPGRGLENLSLKYGMNKFVLNNLDTDVLRNDNPLNDLGIVLGYDQVTNDIYFSYRDTTNNNYFCLAFNEAQDGFSSFYDYETPMFIYNKEVMLTTNNLNGIYEHFAGDYNTFYGNNKASNVVLICNPMPDHEVTFNNLEYKSEALDSNDIEINDYSWESIQAYNEFQDSGLVTADKRKMNRKWRMIIPRNQLSSDRIRNTWAYIKLESNNSNKYFYTNHDIILYYTPRIIFPK